jgi:SAM-dependent methyltransferase
MSNPRSPGQLPAAGTTAMDASPAGSSQDPAVVITRTLSFYEANAAHYARSTLSLDLGKEQQQFLAALPPTAKRPARILDAGCGSGRDAAAFAARGFQVSAFDGCAQLVAQARALTGLPVAHLRFDEMRYLAQFDGIWACASLLHLPLPQLDDALARIHRALIAGGAFYACFKLGEGARIAEDGRYFTDFTPVRLADYFTARGFDVEALTLSRSPNQQGVDQQWVNAFSRKRPA